MTRNADKIVNNTFNSLITHIDTDEKINDIVEKTWEYYKTKFPEIYANLEENNIKNHIISQIKLYRDIGTGKNQQGTLSGRLKKSSDIFIQYTEIVNNKYEDLALSDEVDSIIDETNILVDEIIKLGKKK